MRAEVNGAGVSGGGAPTGLAASERLAVLATLRRRPDELLEWYLRLAPCWLGAAPLLRRRLILRTHEWIAERILTPGRDGAPPAVEDLAPGGVLARRLGELVPTGEAEAWRHWIRLVLLDLRRALRRPVAERSETWARWLFLIPYALPLQRALGGASHPPSSGRVSAARG